MLNRNGSWLTLVATLLCAFSLPEARADEKDSTDQKSPAVKRTFTVRLGTGKHWIGVRPAPIDEAMKSQLGLPDRLIVQHVLSDTPAAKAGIQEHDILLKFGDKELSKVDDLTKAVTENGDKEVKLTILRAGKETTLTIKPGERPEEKQLLGWVPQQPEDLKLWLEKFGEGGKSEDGTMVWRALGPGVWSQLIKPEGKGAEFPNGLSVTVSKENDQPAKIVAKKEGKTYETTEDALDKLPEDIRTHVERLLHGPKGIAIGVGPDGKAVQGMFRFDFDGDRVRDVQKAVEAAKKQAVEHLDKAKDEAAKAHRHRIEIRKLEGSSLDDLRKDIEALRKEIQQLKESPKKEPKDDSRQSP